MATKPLYVASPLLPDLAAVSEALSEIWQSGMVTNHGPFHDRLQERLRAELGVPTAMLFNNGTTALLAALKLFDLPQGSEVITTPFTFAATAHAIAWNGLVPVFADIDAHTLTLDPSAVAQAITSKTSAILGVHVYGSVCDLGALQDIADAHGLRLVYDAAHAFGTKVRGRGIGGFGDATAFSFHATKLFTTIEGGLLTTPTQSDAPRISMLRNFGIRNEEEVVDIGINGKMNEIQSAIGLLNLDLYEGEREKRAALRKKYERALSPIPGIGMSPHQEHATRSEQYFCIRIRAARFGCSRNEIYRRLKERSIFARKYFHPICTDQAPYRGREIVSTRAEPIAERAKSEVLCLPFHSKVTDTHIQTIAEIFEDASKHKRMRRTRGAMPLQGLQPV